MSLFSKRRGPNLGRRSHAVHTTKSGKQIPLRSGWLGRLQARREQARRGRALRLAGMPKTRAGRFFYRLHPKRLYRYWFSREGAIMALKIIGAGTLAGFVLIIGVFAYFRKDLPNIRDVSGNNIGGSILYYDRSGKTLLWEDVDAVKRIPVKDEEISDFIKKATIAVEDKDFFRHGGFDVRGIVRASFNNLFGGRGRQGGSTITQQVVRLTQPGVGRQQTYTRKVKELILSVELEREYTKKEILTGYLNTAPYGGIEYGVEAGAQDYFKKSARDLTLDEAAMLAAIPKSPTYFSPYNKTDFDKSALIGRQHYILDLMEQQGMITREQRDTAKKVDTLAKVQPRRARYAGIRAPWFVLTAKAELERRFGSNTVKRGGWKVTTTLDLAAQKAAEEQIAKGMAQVRRQGGDTAALVAEDVKSGQVVALVGNAADFIENKEFGQNNYAHDLELPPGSSFKPYDYAAIIESQNNAGAGSVLFDSVGPLPGYPCTNRDRPPPRGQGNCLQDYDFRAPGPLSIRYALGGSRNIPAVKAMLIVGVEKTIDIAHRLMTNYGTDGQPDPTIGTYRCYSDEANTKPSACYGAAAIGDGAYLRLDEHVHGFATLSRNGLNIPQTYVLKVVDASDKTITEWKPSKGTQAVRPETAYIISDILSDPNASYLPAGNKPQRYKDWKFAAKTGTTNDSKDGLMMMYSTRYAAGVWVGYHNRQRAMSGFMETMTQPIVSGWMRAIHEGLAAEERPRPAGVQAQPAYVVRAHVGLGSVEPSPATDLFPGWYQAPRASGQKRTIDIVSNKLATDCTPAKARKDVFDNDVNSLSIDTFVKGGAANTSATDDVHVCGEAKPSVSLTNEGGRLIAQATPGAHPLSGRFGGTIEFAVNGQIVSSAAVSADQPTATYSPALDFDGTKQVTAIVTDSVLYDATSAPVTITGSGSPGGGGGGDETTPLNLQSPSVSGNNVTFSWTGGKPPFSVLVTRTGPVPGNTTCGSASRSCTAPLPAPYSGSYRAEVRDGAGNTSNSVTFSR